MTDKPDHGAMAPFLSNMSQDVDPYNWSVDQVVSAFCIDTSWWLRGRPNSSLPNPQEFERILREQEINGSTLLTNINDEILKTDLGIKVIGKRAAITWAIDKLKAYSPRYQAELQGPTGFFYPSHPSHYYPPGGFDHAGPSTPIFQTAQAQNTSFPLLPSAGRLAIEDVTSDPQTMAPPLTQTIQDEPRERPLSSGSLHHSGLDNTPAEKTSTTLSRQQPKRLAPQSLSTPPKTVSQATSSNSYLGVEKHAIDSIFYGNKQFGEELPDAEDDRYEGLVQSKDWFALEKSASTHPPGKSQFVHTSLKYFFKNTRPEIIKLRGAQALAISPYREDTLVSSQPRSITAFQCHSGNDVRVTREDPQRLDGLQEYDNTANHDWDFLHRWQQDNDKVLPALGESDTSEDTALLAEIAAEEKESKNRPQPKVLSAEHLTAIIQDFQEDVIQRWKDKKLPNREKTAWSVWKRSRTQRQLLIGMSQERSKTLDLRLAKLKEAITEEKWIKEKDVIQQCRTLEETVTQREEEVFKRSVWQKTIGPPRPITMHGIKTKKTASFKGEDESESLGSDSEVDGFVVDDHPMVDSNLASAESPSESSPPEDPKPRRKSPRDQLDQATSGASMINGLGDNENLEDDADYEMDLDVVPAGSAPATPPKAIHKTEIKVKEPTFLPTSSVAPPRTTPRQPPAASTVIDLTQDTSDSSSPVKTPRLRLRIFQNQPNYHVNVTRATKDEMIALHAGTLEFRGDRPRLLTKILCQTDFAFIGRLRDNFYGVPRVEFFAEANKVFESWYSQPNSVIDIDLDTGYRISNTLALLLLCWLVCRHRYWEQGPDKAVLCKLLDFKRMGKNQLEADAFHTFMDEYLIPQSSDFERSRPKQTSILISSSTSHPSSDVAASSDELPVTALVKKGKKKIQRNMGGVQMRDSARERVKAHTESQMEQEMVADFSNSRRSQNESISVNIASDEKNLIFIDHHIGPKMKKHQIEGVRFLWRELITTGKSQPQGALLSHTMGLGKTMQVITLISTIALASMSKDQHIIDQIPVHLRKSRTLILCPSGLVNNWEDEFATWVDKNVGRIIGPVCSVIAAMKPLERTNIVNEWYRTGGILIVGYSLFRSFLTEKTNRLDKEDSDLAAHQLLEGPNLIVADEAHTLKNPSSGIARATSQFKSMSRIALTGSPLANKLEEYYAMIDWITPGYLGTMTEFRTFFQEPISRGLYKDSWPADYRRALKRLKVLEEEIAPKVHRATISVLKYDLKSKTEFILFIPLTTLQDTAYRMLVGRTEGSAPKSSRMGTFFLGMMNLCKLLCNHPTILHKRIQADDSPSASKSLEKTSFSRNDNEVDADDSDDAVQPTEILPAQILAQLKDLFNGTSNLQSPHHSHKMELVFQILDNSFAAGDRVLIFSHSIPTLDYLEHEFMTKGKQYIRIDGQTPMAKRTSSIKLFNTDSVYRVALISTRAGGQGFNVVGANRVIILDASFNPTYDEQAIGRAYRLGQLKEVFVYRFVVGGTFEAHLKNAAAFKTQLAYRAVDGKNVKRQAERTSEYFHDPEPVDQADLTEFVGKDPLVLDKMIEVCHAQGDVKHIRNIEYFETLHTEEDAKFTAEELEEIRLDKALLREGSKKGLAPQGIPNHQMYPLSLPGLGFAVPNGPRIDVNHMHRSSIGMPQAMPLPRAMLAQPQHPGKAPASASPVPTRDITSKVVSDQGQSHLPNSTPLAPRLADSIRRTVSGPPQEIPSTAPITSHNTGLVSAPLPSSTQPSRVRLAFKVPQPTAVDAVGAVDRTSSTGSTSNQGADSRGTQPQFPSPLEIRDRIPLEGMKVRDLHESFKGFVDKDKKKFIALVKLVARYDQEAKVLKRRHSDDSVQLDGASKKQKINATQSSRLPIRAPEGSSDYLTQPEPQGEASTARQPSA